MVSTSAVNSALIPARFLATLGHFLAVTMIFYTKADNITSALPISASNVDKIAADNSLTVRYFPTAFYCAYSKVWKPLPLPPPHFFSLWVGWSSFQCSLFCVWFYRDIFRHIYIFKTGKNAFSLSLYPVYFRSCYS